MLKHRKIDSRTLETYGIVVFIFFVLDKNRKKIFLEKNFLLADVKSNVVFRILFLNISNANIAF